MAIKPISKIAEKELNELLGVPHLRMIISTDEFQLIKTCVTGAIHRANAHLAVNWDDKGEALRQVAEVLKLAQSTLADVEKANDNDS